VVQRHAEQPGRRRESLVRRAPQVRHELVAAGKPRGACVGVTHLVQRHLLHRVDLDHADRVHAVAPARLDARRRPAAEGERDGSIDETRVKAFLEEQHAMPV